MQARLKVLHDKANVKQVKLLPVTLIGRSTECNLKIASSQVSRNHCRITLGEDAVYVEDLGSANGTLVDGQLIPAHQPTAIAPGAHLIVGPAEFLIDYVASTSATMVLPRTGVPPIPELPSTEMIFPEPIPPIVTAPSTPLPIPAASQHPDLVVPVPQPMPAQVVSVAVAEAVAPVPPPAAVPVPVAVATVAMPAETSVAPASAMTAPVVVGSALFPDTEILEPERQFDFAESAAIDPEIDQPTEFMFRETVAEAVPAATDRNHAAATDGSKKGGLKSLFSLFGRKDKPVVVATHQASTAVPATAPSVFLPSVDAEAAEATVEMQAGTYHFGASEPVAASASDTVEIEGDQAPQTSSDEDDGFKNFLSQL